MSVRRLLAALAATCAFNAVGFAAEAVEAVVPPRHDARNDGRHLIVAVDDLPEPRVAIGGGLRFDYRRIGGYGGGDAAAATLKAIATDFQLAEDSGWTIDLLRLRCVLFRIPADAELASVVRRLSEDKRAVLVQPLNTFESFADASSQSGLAVKATGATPAAADARFNDPYLGLQRGLREIGADAAQRYASGAGVRVAVIDSSVDIKHPDLAGQSVEFRDFVGDGRGKARSVFSATAGEPELHGTQVAGLIGAIANNGRGIVGVAPGAQLLSYRACWTVDAGRSRCDSYTLAQGLSAAIASGAEIINLSLGGPADPLLERLTQHALRKGIIVVGAIKPGTGRAGFPSGVDGVIAVDSLTQTDVTSTRSRSVPERLTLFAPGEKVLTLAPAGGYDFASGSSFATAHVSGAAALLRSIRRTITAPEVVAYLTSRDGTVNVCDAARRLHAEFGRADSSGATCAR